MSVIKSKNQILEILSKLRNENNLSYYYLFLISINSGCSISKLLSININDIKSDGIWNDGKLYCCNKIIITEFKFYLNSLDMKQRKEIFYNSRKTGKINRSYFFEKMNKIFVDSSIDLKFGNTTCEKTFAFHYYKDTLDIDYLSKIYNKSWKSIIDYIEISKESNEDYLLTGGIMRYKVLDLFCGAGGLSLGFEKSGFNIVGGIDFNEDAIVTHHKNFKDSISICGDIREITDEEAKIKFGNVDVIIGGPPCQGFSSANMWQKDNDDDDRNRLFFEFIRFVEVFKPKALLIENVQGILSKNNGFAKKTINDILEKHGYIVESKVLLASEYGVPQNRRRAFFVGIHSSVGKTFDFNNLIKSQSVTVREAISDLYNVSNDISVIEKEIGSSYQKVMRKNSNSKLYNHVIQFPNENVQARMKHVPQGGNWKDVPDHLWERIRDNRHSSAYRRLDENHPSVTIDTGHMNYFHPKYNRVPSVRESARLQSFPDDFIFMGSKTSQFRQVGNAVPPILSERIAHEILNVLKGEK